MYNILHIPTGTILYTDVDRTIYVGPTKKETEKALSVFRNRWMGSELWSEEQIGEYIRNEPYSWEINRLKKYNRAEFEIVKVI